MKSVPPRAGRSGDARVNGESRELGVRAPCVSQTRFLVSSTEDRGLDLISLGSLSQPRVSPQARAQTPGGGGGGRQSALPACRPCGSGVWPAVEGSSCGDLCKPPSRASRSPTGTRRGGWRPGEVWAAPTGLCPPFLSVFCLLAPDSAGEGALRPPTQHSCTQGCTRPRSRLISHRWKGGPTQAACHPGSLCRSTTGRRAARTTRRR